jgi:hypothetical protein
MVKFGSSTRNVNRKIMRERSVFCNSAYNSGVEGAVVYSYDGNVMGFQPVETDEVLHGKIFLIYGDEKITSMSSEGNIFYITHDNGIKKFDFSDGDCKTEAIATKYPRHPTMFNGRLYHLDELSIIDSQNMEEVAVRKNYAPMGLAVLDDRLVDFGYYGIMDTFTGEVVATPQVYRQKSKTSIYDLLKHDGETLLAGDFGVFTPDGRLLAQRDHGSYNLCKVNDIVFDIDGVGKIDSVFKRDYLLPKQSNCTSMIGVNKTIMDGLKEISRNLGELL